MPEVRLQKVLSRSGLCSRRKAEDMITAGRVSVNGRTAQQLGTKVDPRHDTVAVDGRPVAVEPREYWLLHKPRGTIVTTNDPLGRTAVNSLVDTDARVYPVGRMDADSSGLLLMTNDGDLAHFITEPGNAVEESYEILVSGRPDASDVRRLKRGVRLGNDRGVPLHATPIERESARGSTWLAVETTGGQRTLRRSLDTLGHPVRWVMRTRLGVLRLGDLPEGHGRRLAAAEQRALRAKAGLG
jgi:23S rRNA pseudouridine2605 synthase